MAPHKIIAATTTEALKLVREQVGGDALVLSTRDTAEGVEIVAISPEALAKLSQRPEVKVAPVVSAPVNTVTVSASNTGSIKPTTMAPAAQVLNSNEDKRVDKLLAEFSQVKQLLQTHLSARAWDDIQAQSTEKAEALRIMLNAGFSPQLCGEMADQLSAQGPSEVHLMDRLQALLHGSIAAYS